MNTKWIVREVDKITATVYFMVVILTFILALFFAQGFEDKFVANFQGSELVRNAIVVFSIIAFVLIFRMFLRRYSELKDKAFTTFEFLIGREAMKIEGDKPRI